MKDNFSSASDQYAHFRPGYSSAFFEFLGRSLARRQRAWDCGTGNGQVAGQLASIFEQVEATDISRTQLDHAVQLPNISYSVQPAEQTNFEDEYFDLVIVAQAIHWFDFDRFYHEVRRVTKPDAWLVVTGYGLLNVSPQIDALIRSFYNDVIGPYWDSERKYIDEEYRTIPFPFPEIPAPSFTNTYRWTIDHLEGYLNTWSAVKHFITANGSNPVNPLMAQLREAWGEEKEKDVEFPMLLRIGKIH